MAWDAATSKWTLTVWKWTGSGSKQPIEYTVEANVVVQCTGQLSRPKVRAHRIGMVGAVGIARAVVMESNTPSPSSWQVPAFPGLDSFTGTWFHSSNWPSSPDSSLSERVQAVRGKDVVIVGTGASCVQILPAVATVARTVTVVQRSPTWIIMKYNTTYSSTRKWLFAKIPLVHTLERW
jgi:cation diffusion facilitator CzcD-associated flavoprotein CzcO